jgi:hypothetical protein
MTADIAKIKNEIILYQPDSSVQLDVMVENETVWLTQAQMVTLFDSSKANISEHIKNIYDTHELDKNSTVRKFRTVQNRQPISVVANFATTAADGKYLENSMIFAPKIQFKI